MAHVDIQHQQLIEEVCDSDGVLRLTLNDPATRNSLSEAMLAALAGTLAAARDNPAVRVIVLAAYGPVFCAGHNLKEMEAARTAPDNAGDRGRAYFSRVLKSCSAVMQSIPAHPKPVIAEVAEQPPLPAVSSWQAAILRLPPTRRNLQRRVSISVCSVQRRWWRCRAMLPPNTRWRCC